uniref:Fibronectin type-III domain-containing protein n=1 Tax=Lates calcarifer TaxID=8187 RepID=A0A4W6E8U3_LATCA
NVSTAQVMWGSASGASSYSVEAVTDQGSMVTCNTTNNSCFLNGLQCGQIYNVTVMAKNLVCNNTVTSEPYHLMTELSLCTGMCMSPCFIPKCVYYPFIQSPVHPPTFRPIWRVNNSLRQFPGIRATSLWVMSPTLTTKTATTLPALPQTPTVEVEVDCNSDGAAVVSWNTTYGTANFSLSAIVSGSLQTLCTTQQNSCNVNSLTCGETYNISLTASNDQCSLTVPMRERPDVELYVATAIKASGGEVKRCNSTGSTCQFPSLACGETYNFTIRIWLKSINTSVIFLLDPCVPQNLVTSVDCSMKVVSLSWDASNGTNLYMVSAEAGNQTSALTTNVTTAHFSDLTCGQNYSLTVTPHSQHCPGSSSALASVQTWPCPPSGVSTMQDCLSGIVMVTWQASNGSNYYAVTMQTDTGISQMSMSDSNQSSFPGLMCGYNFSVSIYTSVLTFSICLLSHYSAPCPPQNVSAQLSCSSNDLMISWDAIRDADHFLVSVMAENGGISESCNTTDTACSISSVSCGKTFTIHVTSVRGDCRSQPSQTHSILSGGEDYTANCTTSSNTTCEVEDLACGVLYNFSVIAKNSQCESQPSATIELQTGNRFQSQ